MDKLGSGAESRECSGLQWVTSAVEHGAVEVSWAMRQSCGCNRLWDTVL